MKSTFAVAGLLALSGAAMAQQGDGTRVAIAASIFKPAKVDATPERIAALKAPAGFKVTAFATGLKNARIIAVAPNGDVYLSRRDQGDVLLLRDANGDGMADGAPVTVAMRPGAHGLAIRDNKLYLVTVKELFVADILADGRLGELKMLAGDLPDSGQHPNRTIAFGPDGMNHFRQRAAQHHRLRLAAADRRIVGHGSWHRFSWRHPADGRAEQDRTG